MIFNLRKKALQPLGDLILPSPEATEPVFGMDQAMVDLEWEMVGQYSYTNKKDMVDSYGGVNAMREKIEGIKENPDASRNFIDTVETINTLGSKKSFNLKKIAQAELPFKHDNFNNVGELGEDQYNFENQQISQPPFSKIEDFRNWADNTEMSSVLQQVSGPAGDHLKEAMEQYYNFSDEGEKGQIAAQIFSDTMFPLREEQGVMGQEKRIGSVCEIIKKLAQKTINRNKNKAYNLTKTAQHKSLDNAILWGPGQSRIDPFLHQPVSDWHIVERNKGFGLVVDDIWNIDYETIWRNNIMDKYSRPYKDKDGNYVGGYIQKRFEVDKNIPETNNMQLKPGQKRRPILPEYGNTESRLQAARSKGDIAGAIDTSKPFNWKEASKKKS